jgi:hypothetical protein
MWREVESPDFVHLVYDRLDDDVFVFQNGTFRVAVALPHVLDDVKIGESVKVLADCALVPVESASEVADGFDVAMTVEIADKFETAFREDVAAVLPPQDEDVRVSLRIQVAGKLVLLENPLVDAFW